MRECSYKCCSGSVSLAARKGTSLNSCCRCIFHIHCFKALSNWHIIERKLKTCIIPKEPMFIFCWSKWRKIGYVSYNEEQRDNAIYDNEMFYFPFVDDIIKTKTYFDTNTLLRGFTCNKIEKKYITSLTRC